MKNETIMDNSSEEQSRNKHELNNVNDIPWCYKRNYETQIWMRYSKTNNWGRSPG
jgi:hypothetical protein